ncbi:MAG: cytochrome c3 family protein, partial [Spartobacteria bacterium]
WSALASMSKPVLSTALILVAIVAATLAVLHFKRAQVAVELAVSPGELSQPHAFLDNNCAACHSAGKGIEAQNCIVCHANNNHVLQRQPTAFHAEISSCVACHVEHQGRVARTTKMDHTALTRIAFTRLKSDAKASAADVAQAKQLKQWLGEQSGSSHLENTHLKPEERLLNCATCHQTKDRHVGLFGTDCASCHSTSKWTVAEFRHPAPSSQSCAQCHQAPPSHYMMHFKMIDQAVCGQPNAKVNQCFLCHQTTAWNDIKGVGYYKHH